MANAGSVNGGADSITVYPAGSNGNVTPSAVITGSNTGLSLPGGLALDSTRNIYVTNQATQTGPGSVTEYAAGSNGNVTPLATITGSSTGLLTPVGIAIDSSGNIYVTNDDYGGGDPDGTVEVFPPGSSGNVGPMAVILGSCSGLDGPQGVAVDPSGNIYVANSGQVTLNPDVAIYPAPSGWFIENCVTPTNTITADLVEPAGLTLDSSSNIYVTDSDTNSILLFLAGSSSPSGVIADPAIAMDNPLGVALDSSLNIYVANAGTLDGGFDSVTVYPAGSYADVAPSAVIGSFGAPDNTGLNYPSAILVGPGGGIYVANSFGGSSGIGSVTRYAAGSNGNVAPTATLSGSSTGLYDPVSLAMGSEDYLHVLNAFGGPDVGA